MITCMSVKAVSSNAVSFTILDTATSPTSIPPMLPMAAMPANRPIPAPAPPPPRADPSDPPMFALFTGPAPLPAPPALRFLIIARVLALIAAVDPAVLLDTVAWLPAYFLRSTPAILTACCSSLRRSLIFFCCASTCFLVIIPFLYISIILRNARLCLFIGVRPSRKILSASFFCLEDAFMPFTKRVVSLTMS